MLVKVFLFKLGNLHTDIFHGLPIIESVLNRVSCCIYINCINKCLHYAQIDFFLHFDQVSWNLADFQLRNRDRVSLSLFKHLEYISANAGAHHGSDESNVLALKGRVYRYGEPPCSWWKQYFSFSFGNRVNPSYNLHLHKSPKMTIINQVYMV